ncbi:MAG: helix-turn-helix domain-containing protein [Clostridiales bacterium]|jgi:transcriptional regulator with XRE-family HTH domain|nr:helix-turn-helix domain-containing protein [Clostridiales bacterium]
MIDKKTIGERIKEARQAAGITQKRLAAELKLVQQAYSRFETGVFELDYEKLIYIAKRLDVSTDYILGLDEGFGRADGQTSASLPQDLEQTLNLARKLTPLQRAKLIEFIRSMLDGKK